MPWPFSRSGKDAADAASPALELVDLHCHVLPGFDDGAPDLDETTAMLDGLASLGFTRVAATPHVNADVSPERRTALERRLAEVAAPRQGRPPALAAGAEILFDERIFDDGAIGELPGLAGHPIHLVEFGLRQASVPKGVEDRLFRLIVKGVTIVVAHPERCPDFERDLHRLEELHRAGVVLQLDLMSLCGRHGGAARKAAYAILEQGLADVAATDLHRTRDLPKVRDALEALRRFDEAERERLCGANPLALWEGRAAEVRRHD
jgi:protein-tyrosine phosphatase